MDKTLHSPRPHGVFTAIPAKAEAHRALLAAALADAPTRILCPVSNDDIDATVRSLCALGARITADDEGFSVEPLPDYSTGAVLDCGESGSTLRFLLPVAAAVCSDAAFIRRGRLAARPLDALCTALAAHGVQIVPGEPLRTKGLLTGGAFTLPGNISSQFASGILFALPRVGGTLTLTGKIESRPYIAMTVRTLRQFGIGVEEKGDVFTVPRQKPRSPGVLRVGGDWSDAAFFLAMGVLGKEPVAVAGLAPDSPQGDRAIVDILQTMGAKLVQKDGIVTAYPSALHGTEIDAADVPDLVPVLAVAAPAAAGETRIYNAARLRLKESDRLASVCALLTALGGRCSATDDGLLLTGAPLQGGTVCSCHDHRIAMSAAVAAVLCTEPVTVRDAQAVQKSHPAFWEDYRRLCI